MIGPEGSALEVQIRTREMHQHAEFGVAAHWRYKEGGARGASARSRLRRQDRLAAPGARLAATRSRDAGDLAVGVSSSSLFTESIYVLTPQGKVIDLPHGATPVDFAYHLHTDSATAAAARASTARWCRSTTR